MNGVQRDGMSESSNAPFASGLGVRPDTLHLVQGHDPIDSRWTIRVHGAEVWDAVRVEVQPGMRVREVKVAALKALMPDVTDTDTLVVKLGGIEVMDEDATLRDAGVRNGSTLLLMSRRRHAVR